MVATHEPTVKSTIELAVTSAARNPSFTPLSGQLFYDTNGFGRFEPEEEWGIQGIKVCHFLRLENKVSNDCALTDEEGRFELQITKRIGVSNIVVIVDDRKITL